MEGAGLRFMLMAFAGWWRDQQQEAVAYLIEENRILRRQLRGRRLLSSANIDAGRCSCCLWLKTILMMQATEDRRRCDSISSRKPMAS
jgi:hypothetical protein